MTDGPAPDSPPPASSLVEVLAALRAVMSDERRAVARLDLGSLEAINARKLALVDELAAVTASGAVPTANEARAIAAARVELAASASLLGTAVAAVSAVLGLEPDGRYDRLARTQGRARPLRAVAY